MLLRKTTAPEMRSRYSMTADIVFRATGLTKVYRNGALEVHALRNIDFQAREGEFIVILGRQGRASRHSSTSSAGLMQRLQARLGSRITN